MKNQNEIQKWMTRMKNPESTTKNIEQTIGTYKWNRGLGELPDGKGIRLNALIKEWE